MLNFLVFTLSEALGDFVIGLLTSIEVNLPVRNLLRGIGHPAAERV